MFYNDADDNYNSRLVFASISQPAEHPRERLPQSAAAARRLRLEFPSQALQLPPPLPDSREFGVECAVVVALEHEATPSPDTCQLHRV